jgi:hypothetical protein
VSKVKSRGNIATKMYMKCLPLFVQQQTHGWPLIYLRAGLTTSVFCLASSSTFASSLSVKSVP